MLTFKGRNFSIQQLLLKSASAMHLWSCNISVVIGPFTPIWLLAEKIYSCPREQDVYSLPMTAFPSARQSASN